MADAGVGEAAAAGGAKGAAETAAAGTAAAGTAAAATGTGFLGTVGTAIGAGVVNTLFSTILKPQPTEAPKLGKPTVMPDAEAQQAAQEASIQSQVGRRGRASTILTDQSGGSDKLGG